MARQKTTITINTDDIIRQLAHIGFTARQGIAAGLTEAAKGMRTQWREDMSQFIEGGPVPFTKRIFANKARPTRLISTTVIGSLQGEYLRFIVEGGLTRTGSDIGAVGTKILVPVKAKLTRKGNFEGGSPSAWLANLDARSKGRGFVGTPGGGEGGRGAVYERLKTGRLKLLAVFVDRANYTKTLDLEASANAFVGEADAHIQKGLDDFLRSV